MQNRGTPVAYSRLFHNRSFVALWLGQTVSFVGDYFYFLAIPIMVERLTGSAMLVGLSVISSALPMLLLGPVAGVFVDRWDRRRTMFVADILRAALVLACLLVQGPEQVWIYYLVGFLMSSVSRFFFPAQNALLPLIVADRNDLLAANGLMQIVQTVGLLVGPALAGFSIGIWGERVAFFADSATFLLSASAILVIHAPRTTLQAPAAGSQVKAVLREMKEGVNYLFGNRTMVGVLLCLAVVQLGLGAINVTWVPFMQRTFGLGPEGLGAVDTAQGVGMVIGGLLLGFLAGRFAKRPLAGWSILVIGGMIAAIGLAPAVSLGSLLHSNPGIDPATLSVGHRLLFVPLLLLLCSAILGVALVPAQSAVMTMMQLAVPDLKRGRVGSALNAITTAAGLLTMAIAAALGEVVPLRAIYVLAGAVVGAGGLVALLVMEEPEEAVENPIEGLALAKASGD